MTEVVAFLGDVMLLSVMLFALIAIIIFVIDRDDDSTRILFLLGEILVVAVCFAAYVRP
jgi:hypothetical protein